MNTLIYIIIISYKHYSSNLIEINEFSCCIIRTVIIIKHIFKVARKFVLVSENSNCMELRRSA